MNTRKFFTVTGSEFTLAARSPDMILFGFIMPVVIVLIIGMIWSGQSDMIDRNIGAWLSIGICAVGLMGMPLTLSDYRSKKVLKRLQVTPASPALLLSAQLLVQGTLALISALLVSASAAIFFAWRPLSNVLAIAVAWLMVLLSIFSIGMCIASVAADTKKAGILCSIAYFPMLLLSGTTIPLEVFPAALQKLSAVLPLTQGIALLSAVANGEAFTSQLSRILILAAIFVVCSLVSIKCFRWDLQSVE